MAICTLKTANSWSDETQFETVVSMLNSYDMSFFIVLSAKM